MTDTPGETALSSPTKPVQKHWTQEVASQYLDQYRNSQSPNAGRLVDLPGKVVGAETGSPGHIPSKHPFTQIRTDSCRLQTEIGSLKTEKPGSADYAKAHQQAEVLTRELDRLLQQVSDRHLKGDSAFPSDLAASEGSLHEVERDLNAMGAASSSLNALTADGAKFKSDITETIAPAFHDHAHTGHGGTGGGGGTGADGGGSGHGSGAGGGGDGGATGHGSGGGTGGDGGATSAGGDGMILGINSLQQLKDAEKDGLNFSQIRLWDTHTKINQLTNSDGSDNAAAWNLLGQYVDNAHANGKSVMYTFGLARDSDNKLPPMPSNAQIVAFTKQLAQWSYKQKQEGKGGIDTYEMWNEPSYAGFYSGTPEQLADTNALMIKTIHQYDPEAKIASPAVSFNTPNPQTPIDWDDRYFAEMTKDMGSLPFDQIDFHGYRNERSDDTPEQLLQTVASMRKLEQQYGLTAPLVDSEDAFETSKTPNQQDQSDLMARQLILDKFLGVQPGWYAFGNSGWGTMETDVDGKETPSLDALQEPRVMSWMDGANLQGVQQKGDVFLATLIRNGKREVIAWTDGPSVSYSPDPQFTQYQTLAGQDGAVLGDIDLTGQPVLLS